MKLDDFLGCLIGILLTAIGVVALTIVIMLLF